MKSFLILIGIVFICLSFVSTTNALSREETVADLTSIVGSFKYTTLEECGQNFQKLNSRTCFLKEKVDNFLKPKEQFMTLFKRYLINVVQPKLQWLDEESKFLGARCSSPDFDNFRLSLERGARLGHFMNEWRTMVELMRNTINGESYPPFSSVEESCNLTPPSNQQLNTPLQTFRDCKEDYCPEVVVIPTGQFIMGGTEEEEKNLGITYLVASWEKPRHLVQIKKSFAMAAHEITLGAFRQFVKETGYQLPSGCIILENNEKNITLLSFKETYNYEHTSFDQDPNQPVVCVRREDAREYAKWLSKKTNQKYRLATEAEWEYTARAGKQENYIWGNEPNEKACEYANVYDLTGLNQNHFTFDNFNCSDGVAFTAKVGSYKPNGFKIYDMIANAREWVDDCWHYSYNMAPKDQTRWGPENDGLCHFGVLKGGAWAYNFFNVRIAYRNAYFSSQSRSIMWGIRLVRDL